MMDIRCLCVNAFFSNRLLNMGSKCRLSRLSMCKIAFDHFCFTSKENLICVMHAIKRRLPLIGLGCVIFFSQLAQADNMIMARTSQTFPEAMAELQGLIKEKGYVVSRVQRVDIGLTRSGYKTDKYRVVFYGKPHENRILSQRYPELTAYLPLKIAIFAEDQDTILVTANPQHLRKTSDEGLAQIVAQWEKDLIDIFHQMREGH